MAEEPKLGMMRIEGKDYPLDELTLDDVEAIEEACGQPFAKIDWNSARAMKWAAYVLLRRDREDFTIEDAGKIKLVDFIEDEEASQSGPPPEPSPGGESSPSRSAREPAISGSPSSSGNTD